jgi:hypothetical protein
MRTQECRKTIDKAAEACDLSPAAVRTVKQALKFMEDQAPTCSQLATRAVLVLAKEKDKEVLKKAIATTEELIESGHRPTEQEVKEILLTARGGTTPGPELTMVVKQMQANPPTKPPISREEGEIKPKEKPSQTTSQLFDIKKQFPFPGTREEILFRQQVKDMGRWIKLWLGNPDLAPLHPILEGLQRATQETYGDLVKS